MACLGDRIIVLIDMDCFFCQVETRLQPDLQGKPLAVVQYNQWRSGGIIAVNYEARDFGVTRHMRGDEAKEKCPDVVLVSVPSLRGKADTSKYRLAGREVIEVLRKSCSIIERASVDEAYLDVTELVEKKMSLSSEKNLTDSLANTFVVGYCQDETNDEEQRRNGMEKWLSETHGDLGDERDKKLAVAGTIVEELRAEIYDVCKFRCSAGISYNKILAKLACGLHKPNRQTILPAGAVPALFSTLPVKKVRNLGGKFGNIVMESLGCNVMADLLRYSLQDLQKRFDEKTGSWLYNIARGIDNEPVVTRLVCKSIGASKNFPGKQAIVKLDVLKHWVNELSLDVSDRLEQDREENERRATTLTVSFSYCEDRRVVSQSRSCPLKSYRSERIAIQCVDVITKSTQKPIINVSIAAGKFIPAKGSGNFVNFFKNNATTRKSDDSNVLESATDVTSITNDEESSRSATTMRNERQKNPESGDDFSNVEKTNNIEIMEKPKMKIVQTFFTKLTDDIKDEETRNEPISPSTAILGSEQLKKALNRENMKNSFFMNFLKDSKPENDKREAVSTVNEPESVEASASVEKPLEKWTDDENNSTRNNDKIDDNELLAKLQEIFPDLENIDRSVVQLLPMDLQRIASKYVKKKTDRDVQSVKNIVKTSKAKSAKTWKQPRNNSLQSFFVKTEAGDYDEANFRKCPKCDRMISIEKYSEHEDFHVAKNLQREINRVDSTSSINTIVESSSISTTPSKRRRKSDENPRPNIKKAKGISSFFS